MEEWVQSGEGSYGLTYYHRTDPGLFLKLNSESMTYEQTLNEYNLAKAVHEIGIRCPAAMDFATDGSRYGYITERLMGKISFARLLSDNPDMLDSLARDMAEEARMLHSLPCNTEVFESVAGRLLDEANSCKWVNRRLKKLLNAYADGLRPMTSCLHGDMHPGNILRTDKGDFWIDLGRFGYGDPDLDYASQFVLANLAPEYMSEWIIHLDHRTYSRFVELYGQYYYGDDFRTPETQERLRRAICVYLGHALAKSPAAALIFGPYIRGHEKLTFFLIRLISRLVKK